MTIASLELIELQKLQKDAVTQGINAYCEYNLQSSKTAHTLLDQKSLLPKESKEAAKNLLNAQTEAFSTLQAKANKAVEIDFTSEKAGEEILGLFEGTVNDVFAKAEEAKAESIKQVKELEGKLPKEVQPFTGYWEKSLNMGMSNLKDSVSLQMELTKQAFGTANAAAKKATK